MDLINLRTILITALIFIPLERILSLHEHQKVLRKQWFNDVLYLLFNGILIKFGMILVIGSLMTVIGHWMPSLIQNWVGSQPIWLQTIEVLLIADIGFYLAHRAFHVVPFLWKFHSIHHSIEEMDWLAAHRVHPIDQVLTKSASLLPIFALGFSTSAIAIYAVIYHWQALLIHSNTRFKFGIFRWIVASPQFHHWHHANHREAYDKNFAALLPVLDILGGTMHLPGDQLPERYGTDDQVPTRIDQQMLYPFVDKSQTDESTADDIEENAA